MLNYWKICATLILIAFVIAPIDVWGAPGNSKGTPWDTVMANIQVIEMGNEPDSVKSALMQQLFSDFKLTAEDYRRFHDDFLKRSPEEQAAFLKQVEEIILEWMNKDYKKTR